MRLLKVLGCSVVALTMGWGSVAMAKATPEQIASLGGDTYTCMGAERAGTESGVAEYTGKWFKTWPGVSSEYGYEPGPYKDEKPLYTISASNMSQYQDKMTPGQQALMKKYPEAFKMNVYPSHRDFRFADWVCDVAKKNAAESEIIDDGLGVTGTGGAHPFPFPKNGLEAIYNAILPHRAWTEKVVFDIADVYSNGTVAWGRARFMTMNPSNIQDRSGPTPKFTDHINAFFYQGFLLPDREKGFVAVGYQPNNFKSDATQSWQYLPGIRRVRKAPEVGFDYPVPPSGLRTVDDDYLFNGSPERYNWTLVGKKELLVPYHNFKFNSPELSYDDLIREGTVNSDHLRYEMHRVWVVEGNLKDGVRHIYKKRRLYIDEDTWLTVWADNYDGRGELWRANLVAFFYSQESGTFHRGASIYHDLTSGNYEATYLVNERERWWRLNTPLKPAMFSPEAAARSGH